VRLHVCPLCPYTVGSFILILHSCRCHFVFDAVAYVTHIFAFTFPCTPHTGRRYTHLLPRVRTTHTFPLCTTFPMHSTPGSALPQPHHGSHSCYLPHTHTHTPHYTPHAHTTRPSFCLDHISALTCTFTTPYSYLIHTHFCLCTCLLHLS